MSKISCIVSDKTSCITIVGIFRFMSDIPAPEKALLLVTADLLLAYCWLTAGLLLVYC